MNNAFSSSSKIIVIIPILIGIIAFFSVTGGLILLPRNIAWLSGADPQQHYLGWVFFRQDAWRWPLGLNPGFGLELGNAIAFSDSLPLFAIPFKILAPWLPPVFQYFGIWVLLCFLMQAIISWAICGLITRDLFTRAVMTGFFVFAPPMLWRLNGHMSLVGHFLILAAIYLSLMSREKRHSVAFVILLGLSASVHAYFLAMIGAIWIAGLLDGIWRHSISIRSCIVEFLFGILLVFFVCWQVGYFTVGQGGAAHGYGLYRMNALSLLNPDGWSRFLPRIKTSDGDYEGFNYLGFGLILLVLVSIPLFVRGRGKFRELAYQFPFSILLAILFSVFALSNIVGFGGWNLTYPLPKYFDAIANTFRASGRMFWPVYYLIVLVTLAALVSGLGVARARWLLAVALIVQVADTSQGWSFRSGFSRIPSDRWATPMQDPFWDASASRYSNVRWIMPDNTSPNWAAISDFAARHHLKTDAPYLARFNPDKLTFSRSVAEAKLTNGNFDLDSLYLLDKQHVKQAAHAMSSKDFLGYIDGFYVLAPGWRTCSDCPQTADVNLARLNGPLVMGKTISFKSPATEAYRVEGWSRQEPWGVWSGADKVVLGFDAPLPRRFRLTLNALAFGPNVGKSFLVSAGAASTSMRVTDKITPISIEMEGGPEAHVIEIIVPEASSPKELGLSADPRRLGIGVSSVRVDSVD